jgi:glycosyl transferase family 25
MKTLNIFILSKERELELSALLDSFFKHSVSKIPLKITIFYDDSNRETYYHHITYNKFIKENTHWKFIQVNYNDNPPNIDEYLVTGEYNLVLPDNTIFTQDFDLKKLENLQDDDVLDLFKGMNRQKNSVNVAKSLFLSEAHKWDYNDGLYSIEKEGDAFEQIPSTHNHFRYYGKIFVHNAEKPFFDRKIFFYPISPCFINALNEVHTYIDFYDIDVPKQYNPYAFSVRYMCGEIIDLSDMAGYTSNAILDQYEYKFITNSKHKKLHDLVSHAVYINLNHREDRKAHIEKEIEKLNLSAHRIEGEIPNDDLVEEKINLFTSLGRHLDDNSKNLAKSRIGCTLSHLKAVQYAKDNDWDYVLILEDDCQFLEYPLEKINAAIRELDSVPRFDMLYLGANVVTPTRSITPHLAKLHAAWCLHSYILPKHMYDVFLAYDWNNHLIIDSYSMSLQKTYNCYIVAPLVSVQSNSFSDIEQKEVNYSETMKYYFNAMLNKNDN